MVSYCHIGNAQLNSCTKVVIIPRVINKNKKTFFKEGRNALKFHSDPSDNQDVKEIP